MARDGTVRNCCLGHQGSLIPLPSAAQCVVWVRSSTTYLAANHITGSLSLVMMWQWIKLHLHWSVQNEVLPVLVCIWALKMNVHTEHWLKINIWNWKGFIKSKKMPWSVTWSWIVQCYELRVGIKNQPYTLGWQWRPSNELDCIRFSIVYIITIHCVQNDSLFY